jgi:uncharacterized OsmC-like protein
MTTPPHVRVERTGTHRFTATNDRGAEVTFGRAGEQGTFSPGELLLVAIGGCSQLSAESLLARRIGEDAPQAVTVEADKDYDNERYRAVRVTFDVDLSALEDTERKSITAASLRAIERLCTVSRTVENGAEVTIDLDATTLADLPARVSE